MYQRIPVCEKARPNHLELATKPFFCEGESLNVFIPVYLRMVIQKIKQLEMRKLTATLNGYIEMTLNLYDVPQTIADFVKQNVQLQFSRGQSIVLSKTPKCLITTNNFLITFLYGDEIPLVLDNETSFMVPFDLCKMNTTVVISIKTMFSNGKRVSIKFNLMNTPKNDDKFKLDQQVDSGEFKVTGNFLNVQYSSTQFGENLLIEDDLTLKQQIDRSNSYHYAKYTISQYRYPGVGVVSLFVPLWVFAFANLSVFFQGPKLSDRISSIATLMVAYTAFIPFIRERIPLTSRITFLDINLSMLICTCLICLWQSILIRNLPQQGFKFKYKQSVSFIVCLSILTWSVVYVCALFLVHKLVWEPSYNVKSTNQNGSGRQREWTLDPTKWHNQECDRYFSRFAESVRPLRNIRI